MAYFTDVVLTIIMAYLLAISFELPFAALERILFSKSEYYIIYFSYDATSIFFLFFT